MVSDRFHIEPDSRNCCNLFAQLLIERGDQELERKGRDTFQS
jgi:hypothetical protein